MTKDIVENPIIILKDACLVLNGKWMRVYRNPMFTYYSLNSESTAYPLEISSYDIVSFSCSKLESLES